MKIPLLIILGVAGLFLMGWLSWEHGYKTGVRAGAESYKNVCEPNQGTKIYYELGCDRQ